MYTSVVLQQFNLCLYDIWLMSSFILFMAVWLNISGKRGTSVLYLGKTCSAPSLRRIRNLFIIMRQ